jgi:hypothetical protein
MGCQQPVADQREFELVTANGRPLPASIVVDGACTHHLLGGMVRLDPGPGTYEAAYQMARVCNGETMPVPNPGGSGTFHIRGDSLLFFDEDKAPSGGGVLRGDSLVIQGPAQLLVFRESGPHD